MCRERGERADTRPVRPTRQQIAEAECAECGRGQRELPDWLADAGPRNQKSASGE